MFDMFKEYSFLTCSIFKRVDDALGGEKKSLKKRREEQRKAAEASGDTRAWNSLFMRPNTVCILS